MSRKERWKKGLALAWMDVGLTARELSHKLGLRRVPRGARIHVGCGPERLEGWVNVDIVALPSVDLVLDVSRSLPFRDAEALFAEHFLEHLRLPEALRFLELAHQALAPGAWLRLSTPNLAWLWQSQPPHQPDGGGASLEALKAAIAPNRCFYGWEHRFLWSRCLLTEFLEAAGFEDVRYCAYGESALPHFRGIERHLREPETPELPHVLIVEARKGAPKPERLVRLRQLIADDFLRHLSPEHLPRA